MSIGERIRNLRESRNLTQTALAEIAGVTDKAVSSWENDASTPRMGALEKMCNYFGVTKSYIIEGEDGTRFNIGNLPIARHSVPLIDHTQAGDPIVTWVEYYTQPGEEPHADFAVLIDDNSMEPTYRKGDVVYIQKGYKVDNGKIAAVVIDDQTTLKRIYQKPDGLLMVSDNLEYEPIFAANSGYMVTRILGVPVGFTRMYQPEEKGEK